MTNERVYLHETIDIIGQGRAAYNEHMCAYIPTAIQERRLQMVGNFSTVGTTDRWPESINLWEFLDGWDGVARNFAHEFNNPVHQDKNLVPWWTEALKHRSGGLDRLMLASAQTPRAEQLHSRGRQGFELSWGEHRDLAGLEVLHKLDVQACQDGGGDGGDLLGRQALQLHQTQCADLCLIPRLDLRITHQAQLLRSQHGEFVWSDFAGG